MTINEIAKKYHTDLDDADRAMIDRRVEEKGIEEYLNQQLVYLDCSRVLQGMRMMQTIGYPYKREISSYFYAVETYLKEDEGKYDYYCVILADRHLANIKYEKENPPVWYDDKSKKAGKRKPKAKEGDMFPEESKKAKISKAEAKLKAKLLGANLGFGGFKFKKD
jgi:hypothetical protein